MTARTRCVVVVTDLDDDGDVAIAAADAWARPRGAALHVAHVAPLIVEHAGAGGAAWQTQVELQRAIVARAAEELSRRVARVVRRRKDGAHTLVLVGDPRDEIALLARSVGAELLVVSERLVHGGPLSTASTSWRELVRASGIPVLIARGRPTTNVTLAATDLSDARLPALRAAAARRERPGRLIFLHSIGRDGEVQVDDAGPRIFGALQRLGEAARSVGAASAECRVSRAEPAGTILKAAEEMRADLIVVGARRRADEREGGTTASVVAGAPCSVLLVPMSDATVQ